MAKIHILTIPFSLSFTFLRMYSKITGGLILFLLPLTLATHEYAIVENLGDISFFEQTWTHTNNLNLRKYVENSIVLQNATDKLIKICELRSNDTNCHYFRENVEKNALIAQNEINQILHHKRVKRGAWLEFGKTLITQILITCGVMGATHLIESNRMDELQEQQQRDRQILMNMMEINHIQNNLTTILIERIDDLERKMERKDDLNELINIARQSLEDHKRDTEIYMKIFANNFRQDFFKINNIDQFEKNIREINSLLFPYACLPTLDPYELLDVSSLTYTNNKTHISVHTRIPILSFKNIYPLFEYVPIPFKSQNSVYILDDGASFFYTDNNNITKMILPSLLNQCKQISNHTICDSVLHDSLHNMTDCMASIIRKKEPSSQCTLKELEFRNYFVKLAFQKVFCFILLHP